MKNFFILLGMLLWIAEGHAQNPHSKLQQSLDQFRKEVKEDFENFRQQCLKEYAQFVSNPWVELNSVAPMPLPDLKPVPPVVIPEDEKLKPIKNRPIIIKEVVKPKPVEPQPQPVEPIEEVPVVVEKQVTFKFFGTEAKVRFDVANRISLPGISEKQVANTLKNLPTEAFDNMLIDCLALRDNMQLSDWAYLQMLKALAETIQGKGTNEASLLLAYLYMMSGYKMRLASEGGHLYMLYGSPYRIYDESPYVLDGMLYYGVEPLPTRMHISQAAFRNEKALSLAINTQQRFAANQGETRTVVSKQYPDVKFSVKVNKNLMDFYATYPTSYIDDNMMTRWALYANTPMNEEVRQQIYPTLQEQLKGLNQMEAVSRLLNMVQTGFVYEYDNKVWGHDRAFFAEESLYYSYCDCEDRSILLTRMVRDLLGLKCVLVYYPGHLASAIAFTEDVKGDYLTIDGQRFVIADGTYIGAPVGRTMPDMDNSTAKAIVLQ